MTYLDISSKKEKIESSLSRSKADLSTANAKILVYEQDITKIKKQSETLSKEKSNLLEQLMKQAGSSDSVELKIEKATDILEEKVKNEIKVLKVLFVKELEEVKSQLQKSNSITTISNDKRATGNEQNVTINEIVFLLL